MKKDTWTIHADLGVLAGLLLHYLGISRQDTQICDEALGSSKDLSLKVVV